MEIALQYSRSLLSLESRTRAVVRLACNANGHTRANGELRYVAFDGSNRQFEYEAAPDGAGQMEQDGQMSLGRSQSDVRQCKIIFSLDA